LAGTAAHAITIAARQHGAVFHGAVRVSRAGAGGRLQVNLFATRAAVTGARQRTTMLVGRLARRSVPAGIARFAIQISPAAKRALARSKHLKLTVTITLISPHGARVSATRTVTMIDAVSRRATRA